MTTTSTQRQPMDSSYTKTREESTDKNTTGTSYQQKHEAGNIISERIVEHEILVPKRVVREEIIEKVLVIPETVVREEIVEELQKVRETIIEVAKPVYHEKIVEVPEIEFREKIIEVPEKIIEEKTREVPKKEQRNRYVEVTKYVDYEGNEIEPPETEVREIIVEKIVEVPEIQEEILVHEVQVPQYIEKVIEPKFSAPINIPVPVKAVTTYDYELKHPIPIQNDVEYPLYVPRFIEVPVCAEFYDAKQLEEMQATQQKLNMLVNSKTPLRISEIEALATDIRQENFLNQQASPRSFKNAITQSWKSGQFQMIAPQNNIPTAMS